MNSFALEIQDQIDRVRTRLDDARTQQDEHLESVLLGELESLVGIADRNDLDTNQLHQVLAVETGSIPVIPDPDEH